MMMRMMMLMLTKKITYQMMENKRRTLHACICLFMLKFARTSSSATRTVQCAQRNAHSAMRTAQRAQRNAHSATRNAHSAMRTAMCESAKCKAQITARKTKWSRGNLQKRENWGRAARASVANNIKSGDAAPKKLTVIAWKQNERNTAQKTARKRKLHQLLSSGRGNLQKRENWGRAARASEASTLKPSTYLQVILSKALWVITRGVGTRCSGREA